MGCRLNVHLPPVACTLLPACQELRTVRTSTLYVCSSATSSLLFHSVARINKYLLRFSEALSTIRIARNASPLFLSRSVSIRIINNVCCYHAGGVDGVYDGAFACDARARVPRARHDDSQTYHRARCCSSPSVVRGVGCRRRRRQGQAYSCHRPHRLSRVSRGGCNTAGIECATRAQDDKKRTPPSHLFIYLFFLLFPSSAFGR